MEEETKKPIKKPYVPQEKRSDEKLVRILSKDIEGRMKLYAGLTTIKGVSWAVSNAICTQLKLNKDKKIGDLTEDEIKKINEFMKEQNPNMPKFLLNQRKNYETGDDEHYVSSDLELKNELDIKRMKKIKCYKGLRHTAGLPVRGQRTRAHFRKNRRKGSGIKREAEGKKETTGAKK